MAGSPRIGPRRPRRIFLEEWRKARGLSQKALGERFDPAVSNVTVGRWERAARGERGDDASQMNDDVRAAVAEALDIEVEDLYRHPDQPSADALLRNADEPTRDAAFKMLEGLVGRKAGGGRGA